MTLQLSRKERFILWAQEVWQMCLSIATSALVVALVSAPFIVGTLAWQLMSDNQAHASTGSFVAWERELGAQKLTPTTSTALTLPAGTLHAEFYVEGGTALVRWNGGAPVDSATGAMKWPDGHFRKEENDGGKLSGFRALCADCTVWVNYFGRR